ncbi:MAG: Zn-ribbon domain-containing OB-fold protein [Gammaproteobacteria bacterium]
MRANRPIPTPTPESAPFWEHCRAHELWLQRCLDCARPFFYPRFHCPACASARVEWFRSGGRGRIYSFVINQRPPPWMNGPYVIALVELDEGPRMMGNLLGIEPTPARVRVDMPVEVTFEDLDERISLPQWRPVREPRA